MHCQSLAVADLVDVSMSCSNNGMRLRLARLPACTDKQKLLLNRKVSSIQGSDRGAAGGTETDNPTGMRNADVELTVFLGYFLR
jgi:hypothetical protein